MKRGFRRNPDQPLARAKAAAATVLFLVLAGPTSWSADPIRPTGADGAKPPPAGSGRGYQMNYGSLLGYTINCRSAAASNLADNLALKGVAIKLGAAVDAAVCFDTDLMRYAAGWTGSFLDISQTHLNTYKGSTEAFVSGTIHFSTGMRPGWLKGGDFADPRPLHAGPLPRDWAKYKGLYRHGDQVVLNYTVGGNEVFEMPGCETTNGIAILTRTFHIERLDAPATIVICEVPEGRGEPRVFVSAQGEVLGIAGAPATFAGVAGLNAETEARLELAEGKRLQLALPSFNAPVTFKIVLWTAATMNDGWRAGLFEWERPVQDPRGLCHGGSLRWPEPILIRGRPGSGSPYAVDTLTVPENNPWHSWMRLVALDFFSDGRAALSTWNGDVWIVSGIDEKLEKLSWKRYAAGLFEPLGLKIVKDTVYVTCRDQITRLHDLNQDGEADFYENFNNDAPVAPSYHAFAFELQTDREGNFYFTRCGQRVDPALPLNGGMIKVSQDGTQAELFATGLRAANGMSIGPNDEITAADNQGNWVPASRLDWVKRGGFYGYVPHARMKTIPTDYEKPICWIPHTLDNSSGGQVWVTSDKWGPFQGHLLHTSYGKSSLFHVLMEEVEGQVQGGVVQFPLRFDSGIMRGRFHPVDGQLYVCGLKGWQTTGIRDGVFQRVRYTGRPVHMPHALHVASNGIHLTFTAPLEKESALDEQNYAIEQWNYRWTEKYGSPDFSVLNSEQQGRDPVAIKSIALSADRKRVFLEIPGLQPVMQMKIQCRLQAEDGSPVACEIYNTINRIPTTRGSLQ